MKYNNYSVSKAVFIKSSLIQSLDKATCDSILYYMNLDENLFKEISCLDLEKKKVVIVDIYLNFSNEVSNLVDYSKIMFPSIHIIDDLVNILEEILDDVLDEI